PLDVGRSARLATSGQLKALRVRDGGCVHPGCTRTSAYCDAHHVGHWADGGLTALTNLVLLCRHHHRTLHAGLWSLEPDIGQPGRFWASTAGWQRPAQTAADRSPPMVVGGSPRQSSQP
ncbi:MAG: HNH endonuclease signature motif containing protein, partial [Jiangellales bacterium]